MCIQFKISRTRPNIYRRTKTITNLQTNDLLRKHLQDP
jgi:hypothetical protein